MSNTYTTDEIIEDLSIYIPTLIEHILLLENYTTKEKMSNTYTTDEIIEDLSIYIPTLIENILLLENYTTKEKLQRLDDAILALLLVKLYL